MNRNTWILLAIFIVFALGYYFFISNTKKSTFNQAETSFAVQDTLGITEIRMTGSIKGEIRSKVTLTRKNGYWMVDGKYPGSQKAIETLLASIKQIRVREAVLPQAKENVLGFLRGRNIHVEITSAQGHVGYFVGGATQDGKGTFVLMEGAENPYIAEIPGFEGYLGARFSSEAAAYREYILWQTSLDDFVSITQTGLTSWKLEYDSKNQYFIKDSQAQPDTHLTKLRKDKIVKLLAQDVYTKYLPQDGRDLNKEKPVFQWKLKTKVSEETLSFYAGRENSTSWLVKKPNDPEVYILQDDVVQIISGVRRQEIKVDEKLPGR
jgi:cbb3-type cytochrome oxidase subunit 3